VKKLLVVTPTLGKSQWLADSIASIPENLCSEHIIVAPGSASLEITRETKHLRVVSEPVANRGMYAAINHGIRAATEPWDLFCYLNDDDYLMPEYIRFPFHKMINKDRIYYGKTSVINASGRHLYTGSYQPWGDGVNALLYDGIMPFMQVSIVIPRKVIETVGLFNEDYKYCGDFDFICRAMTQGVRFEFCDLMTGAFRINVGQLSSHTTKMATERDRIVGRLPTLSRPSLPKIFISRAIFRIWNLPGIFRRISKFGLARSGSVYKGQK